MKQLIIFNLIWILFASCSVKQKKEVFNPKAIELNNKAVELMKKLNNDSALILFDKAIAVDKTYYLPHSSKSVIYIRKKEFDKALTEMEMAVKKRPDFTEGWNLVGMLNEKLGNIETAMKCYKKSLAIFDERIANPAKKEFLSVNRLNRAYLLILLGQEKEGKEEMRKLKEEMPNFTVIDEFIKLNKQDYFNQIFKDN
jgi:tetratricopeptide (TPR) repeat protein